MPRNYGIISVNVQWLILQPREVFTFVHLPYINLRIPLAFSCANNQNRVCLLRGSLMLIAVDNAVLWSPLALS